MIHILFFGPVAERVGTGSLSLPYTDGVPLQTVREQLQSRYPEAFELVCFTAVNGEMVRDDARVLADGDEVVFMSKFSGG
jgi:molybdopterin synthase sulfur carrier subunit